MISLFSYNLATQGLSNLCETAGFSRLKHSWKFTDNRSIAPYQTLPGIFIRQVLDYAAKHNPEKISW